MDEPLTAPFLSGEDIYLRKLTAKDIGEKYVAWMNDKEVTRYLESGFFPTSADQLHDYVERQSTNEDVVFLSIVEADTDEHVGNVKLGPIDWVHRQAEIGLVIGEKQAWGNGYGTTAVQLLTSYASDRLNLHKLVAHCYEPNVGSKRVFEKAGYEVEATLTDHAFCDGQYVDVLVLGSIH